MDVELKLPAIALVVLSLIGCDQSVENAPEEGSCQAMVNELLDAEECEAALGLRDPDPDVRIAANCASEVLGLDDPPDEGLGGEANQVAYQALCDIHGNTAVGYCDTSAQLGCEG